MDNAFIKLLKELDKDYSSVDFKKTDISPIKIYLIYSSSPVSLIVAKLTQLLSVISIPKSFLQSSENIEIFFE